VAINIKGIGNDEEDYFYWPILPEAPSSLRVVLAERGRKLTWENHDGNPTGIVVERRRDGTQTRASWERIAKLGAEVNEYLDAKAESGRSFAYRVRAINSNGESAYSNVASLVPAKAR
jgi:hypothetical protein